MWLQHRRRIAAAIVALILGSSSSLRAGQAVLQNDIITDFSEAVIITGFIEDEYAASWLTSTCAGNLTTVRILWLSEDQTAPNVLAQAITIWEGGTFPTPGPVIDELLGPVLTDGFFNDFTLPEPIPLTMGQTVVVGLQFLDPPPAPQGPSVVRDVGGCVPQRNAVFAIPGGWLNICGPPFFLQGDFSIRAVVDCGGPLFADGFESGDTSVWSSTVP